MNTEKIWTKFGFVKDENNSKLKEVLKDNEKLKEVHIDIYSENPLISSVPFMLLLRTSEKDAMVSNDGDRVILKKNDGYETHFMNVLFSKMSESFINISDGYSESIVKIQNIYYRITVLNWQDYMKRGNLYGCY